jgi:hypothetical protein
MWRTSKTIPPEKKSLLRQTTPGNPSKATKATPLGEVERIRRNNEFLKKELRVEDADTLALASQTMEPVLSALLDPDRPVLQVTCEGDNRFYRVLKTQPDDLDKLMALGRFLLEHKQRAAFYVLTTSVVQLQNRLDHPRMGELLQVCVEAIQQSTRPDESIVQAVRAIAVKCAQRHLVSHDVLALFFPGMQAARNNLLRALGASEQQCQQVQAHLELCNALDSLLSVDPPLLGVSTNDEGGQYCAVPRGSDTSGCFDQAIWIAYQLLDMKLPKAVDLFAALSCAAHNQGGREIQLLKGFVKALQQTPAGFAPELLMQLSQRACELAASGALDTESLSDFEAAAQHQGALDCQVLLCRQRIDLGLQRLQRLKDPQQRNQLASRLMSEILEAHALMRRCDATNTDAINLMASLLGIGVEHQAPWLHVVQNALKDLTQPTPH